MVDFTREELESEVWKDIPEYEGFYQVSDLGRVKGLAKIIIEKTGKVKNKKEFLFKPIFDKDGYTGISLSKNGKSTRFKVHRLVLSVFEKISELPVDHVNGIKDDNRLKNLRYCTTRENIHFHRKSENNHGYVGVSYENGLWRASIKIEGVSHYLGMYKCIEQASTIYNSALKEWVENKIKPEKYVKKEGRYITFHKRDKLWQVVYKGKFVGSYKTEALAEEALSVFKNTIL